MARELMSPASDESIAVRMVAILRRRALIATVAFTTILAAAVAFAVYLPDLYTASAIVTIERPLPDGVVRTTVSNELESRLYQIRQEVLSRERLTGLIKRFNLYPELRKKTGFEDVLNQARDDIKWEANGPEQVSGRAKTVAFTLTYTGTEQRSVADVTNAIAQFFVEHNSAMRAGEARRAVELLNGQLGAAKQHVATQEARLRTFTLQNQAQLPQAAGVAMAAYQSLADELRDNRVDQRRNTDARDKLVGGARGRVNHRSRGERRPRQPTATTYRSRRNLRRPTTGSRRRGRTWPRPSARDSRPITPTSPAPTAESRRRRRTSRTSGRAISPPTRPSRTPTRSGRPSPTHRRICRRCRAASAASRTSTTSWRG